MSDPNVCFFGVPAMGSWKVRAQQIASARSHWSCAGDLEPHDITSNDVFVAVKRPFRTRLRLLRAMGKATVYDVVDCWSQPDDGLRYRDLPGIRDYFARFVAGLPVDGVIFPNRQMLADLGDLVPNPIFVYHHFWPGLEPIEVREQARIVGYQGAAAYLGPWRDVVEAACHRLGLQFVVNPPDLRAVDIGFAARGGVHASLLARRYKSNVKLTNFYGAGIPCVVDDADISYHEIDNGEVRFFATASEVEDRLVELLPYETRLRVHRAFVATRAEYTLDAIAEKYERWLQQLNAGRSAGTRLGS